MKGKFFVMMFVIILLVGTVSAFEFDNVKKIKIGVVMEMVVMEMVMDNIPI